MTILQEGTITTKLEGVAALHIIQNRLSIQDPDFLSSSLADFIYATIRQEGRSGCVIGNSGGVDSALVAALARRSLDKKDIHLFFLPERDTHKDSRADAYLVAEKLGLTMQEINITSILRKMGVYRLEPPAALFPRSIQERYSRAVHKRLENTESSVFLQMLRGGGTPELQKHMAYYSTKNRVRMAMLYHHAELTNSLVLGTCNRSEKMTGLFIKYGDGACDIAPLDSLYKTQVFKLAEHLDVPREIIEKVPIGDLAPGISDESTLKLPYEKLDMILAGFELGVSDEEIEAVANVTRAEIDHVRCMVEASDSMRHGPYYP